MAHHHVLRNHRPDRRNPHIRKPGENDQGLPDILGMEFIPRPLGAYLVQGVGPRDEALEP